jgi:NitT/TauT family transport system substrate-binding protein
VKFLPLLAASFGLFVSVASAQAPKLSLTKVAMSLDWIPAAEQGGYFCALVNGYYRDAGLDVTITPATPGSMPPGSMLLSGRIQFVMGTSDGALLNRARGLPLVAVMATMEHDPKAVMVHADSNIHTFPDLDGHKLAVVPGNPWYLYVTHKYHLQHIEEMRLTMNTANFLLDPTYSQECFVTSEPFYVESRGVPVRTLLVRDTGYDIYRVLLTTDDFVARHHDVVQAFVNASIKGWRTYLTEPANCPTDQAIKKGNPEMPQDLITYSKKVMNDWGFVAGDPAKGEAIGRMNLPRFAATYQILRDLNIIGEIDYTKAVDLDFTK